MTVAKEPQTMRTNELTEVAPPELRSDVRVHLPAGLFGFEGYKQYVLRSSPEESPFYWLEVDDDPSLAFLVLPPFLVNPDYAPDLGEAETSALDLKNPGEAILLNIVTLRPQSQATVNLKGPVVINRRTLRGRQVVPTNAADYSLQHPLPTAGN